MKYHNGTADAAVKATGGRVFGIIVNSHSSGTLRLNDGANGTTAAGVKATGVFTSSGAIANNDTVTIGPITYTFKTTLETTSPYQVLLGANAAAALDNLKSAINDSGTEGTHYSVGTNAHPYVTATTNTDTAQTVEARVTGTSGNAIATTETCANCAWGAATMENGAVTNTLVMNTYTYPAGSGTYMFGVDGIEFKRGVYVTKGGTIDFTILYD